MQIVCICTEIVILSQLLSSGFVLTMQGTFKQLQESMQARLGTAKSVAELKDLALQLLSCVEHNDATHTECAKTSDTPAGAIATSEISAMTRATVGTESNIGTTNTDMFDNDLPTLLVTSNSLHPMFQTNAFQCVTMDTANVAGTTNMVPQTDSRAPSAAIWGRHPMPGRCEMPQARTAAWTKGWTDLSAFSVKSQIDPSAEIRASIGTVNKKFKFGTTDTVSYGSRAPLAAVRSGKKGKPPLAPKSRSGCKSRSDSGQSSSTTTTQRSLFANGIGKQGSATGTMNAKKGGQGLLRDDFRVSTNIGQGTSKSAGLCKKAPNIKKVAPATLAGVDSGLPAVKGAIPASAEPPVAAVASMEVSLSIETDISNKRLRSSPNPNDQLGAGKDDDWHTSSETESEDPSFTRSMNRNQKREANRRQKSAESGEPISAPVNQQTTSSKVKPLVVEGLTANEKQNHFAIRKLIPGVDALTSKTVETKRGFFLVFPKDEGCATKLLKLTLRDGLTIRGTKGRSSGPKVANNVVVVKGVHPSITDEELSTEFGRSCKRITSVKTKEATFKVKVSCVDANEKQKLLKEGAYIGRRRYQVEPYLNRESALLCHQCLAFGHVKAVCTSVLKCSNCAGSHRRSECDATISACANCGGPHGAFSYECPKYVCEMAKKDVKALSYANVVKRGGDRVESARLACSMAASVSAVLIGRLNLVINKADICKDIADSISRYYKVDVPSEYILQSIASSTASSTTNQGETSTVQHG